MQLFCINPVLLRLPLFNRIELEKKSLFCPIIVKFYSKHSNFTANLLNLRKIFGNFFFFAEKRENSAKNVFKVQLYFCVGMKGERRR